MSSRTCASCQREMYSFRYGEITLDGCTQCNSLWFDAGELEAFAGADRVEAALSTALQGSQARRCKGCGEAFADTDGERCVLCGRPAPSCPVCPSSPFRIGQVRVSQDCTIEVDVCPKCRGIHLDGGELVKIAADKSRAIEAQAKLNRIGDAQFASRHEEKPPPAECSECLRRLEQGPVFVQRGRLYCERCAPVGARLCRDPRDALAYRETLDDVLTDAMRKIGRHPHHRGLGTFMDLFFK